MEWGEEMKNKVLCPVCWNRETMRARTGQIEPDRDDAASMIYARPYGGPKACVVSKWDGGRWSCGACGFEATPNEAGVLLDAVLMVSIPDCDSVEGGVRIDVTRAFNCGVDRAKR